MHFLQFCTKEYSPFMFKNKKPKSTYNIKFLYFRIEKHKETDTVCPDRATKKFHELQMGAKAST